MKTWQIIAVSSAAFLAYLLPYGVMKLRCSSPSYTPSDPWTGPYPQMKVVSNIPYWGDFVDYWGESDFSVAEIKMNYRDPGYKISNEVEQGLNWIYIPIQKLDVRLTGWAVRFRVLKDPLSDSRSALENEKT